jgi:hypothetical protein
MTSSTTLPTFLTFQQGLDMEQDDNRILGRVLAVEELLVVAGAKPTSTRADTLVDVNGNPDTSPTLDSGTVADATTTMLDPSPSTI